MPSWPATLPDRPLVNGSSIEDESNEVAAPADVGIGQSRSRYTAEGQFVTFTWRMSDDQYEDFRDWYHDRSTGIAGGSLAFDMDDPVTGDPASYKKIAGTRPRYTPVKGGRWAVSMQLYRYP